MAGLGSAERSSVVIRKYANRRLYDPAASRYVTLDDLGRMIEDGIDVRVEEARSGTDITRQVLAQVVLEGGSTQGALLDEDVLSALIRARRHPGRQGLARHIARAIRSYNGGSDAAAREPIPVQDAQFLRARIESVQERLRRLVSELDNPKR